MSFDYNAWKRAYLASERQRTAGGSAAAAPAPRVAQRAADAMDDDVVEIVEVQNANGGLPHVAVPPCVSAAGHTGKARS